MKAVFLFLHLWHREAQREQMARGSGLQRARARAQLVRVRALETSSAGGPSVHIAPRSPEGTASGEASLVHLDT